MGHNPCERCKRSYFLNPWWGKQQQGVHHQPSLLGQEFNTLWRIELNWTCFHGVVGQTPAPNRRVLRGLMSVPALSTSQTNTCDLKHESSKKHWTTQNFSLLIIEHFWCVLIYIQIKCIFNNLIHYLYIAFETMNVYFVECKEKFGIVIHHFYIKT